MKDLLSELQVLLDRHNAVIVRSANESGTLVLCKQNADQNFTEIEFNEEINVEAIKYKWYKDISTLQDLQA